MAVRSRFSSRLFCSRSSWLLAAGLVWGLAGAFAVQPEPVAGGRHSHAQGGLDAPTPTTSTRSSASSSRATSCSTSATTSSPTTATSTWRPSRASPRAGPRARTASPGRSRSARGSSGATASRSRRATSPSASTTRRSSSSPPSSRRWTASRRSRRPTTRRVVIECDKPKADILAMWVPDRAGARLEQVQDLRRGHQVPQQPPIVGSGPFQVVEWQKGKFIRCVANKELLGRQAQGRRDHLPGLQEPGHAGPGPQARRHRPRHQHPAGPGQGAAGRRGARRRQACSQKAFDYLSFNCYEGPSLGNPVLKDVKFRQALNWAVDKDKLTAARLPDATPTRRRRSSRSTSTTRTSTGTGSRRPTSSTRSTSTKAKQAARRRRLQGHRRRRHPQRPQERRQEHQAAPLVAQRVGAEPGHGQAHHRLVGGSRPRHPVLGRGQRRAHRRRLQLRRRHVQAGLRHLHLGVAAQRLGPGPASGLLPHRADREPERRLLVEQAVRRPVARSSRRSSTRRSARRSPTRCRRSSTRSRRTSSSRTPSCSRRGTREKWEGWQRIPQPNGAVAYISDNVSNYYKVAPKAAETDAELAAARTRRSSSSSRSPSWWSSRSCCSLLRRKPRAEEG